MADRFYPSTSRAFFVAELFFSGVCLAGPVTYTLQGIGSGTLTTTGSSTPEQFENSAFTFSFTTDTTRIVASGSTFSTPFVTGGTVSIVGPSIEVTFSGGGGKIAGTFSEGLSLQVNAAPRNNESNVRGLTNVGGGSLSLSHDCTACAVPVFVGGSSPSLAGYNLRSAFGPLALNSVQVATDLPSISTSFGSFRLTSVKSAAFSAVSAVPSSTVSGPTVRVAGASFLANGQAVRDYQYSGSCPAVLKFGWNLIGTEPETVKYSFVRSDGSHSATSFTAALRNANQPVPVYDQWSLGANNQQFQNYKGWVQLNIESPNPISQKIAFTMHCGPPPLDSSWPVQIEDAGIDLVVYQPQVDSWKQDRLEARVAATATRQGQTNEIFGVATISARTEVDKETRMVDLEDFKVTSVDFPGAGPGQADLVQMMRNNLPSMLSRISLDRLQADVAVGSAESEPEAAPALKNDPPKIIFSASPAVLILIDGEPVYQNIEGAKYRRVINTPALLVNDPATSTFYLDGQTLWMVANNLNGPWSQPAVTPPDLEQVRMQAAAQEEQDPHDHSNDPEAPAAGGPPPTVYISTTPAELIQTQGAPQFTSIPKTQLLYVSNTGSDIFADAKKQNFYILLSGRWFTAKTMNGPWIWIAGDKLPRDFSRIPPDNVKAAVLASVPGTVEAREAVVANQVPQTATVLRSDAKLTVTYDGAPKFMPIEGTTLEYAVNTATDVIHAGNRYYALQNAIWFVSGSPLGPWVVADSIPVEIYSIPPSSPLYHVRFVYVYSSSPDYVEFGYTPGYLGAFVSDGVVVLGTGWSYPGWCGDMYFGWPWTWGFGFQFGYWTGGWFWRPTGGYWWYRNPPNVHRVYHEHWNPHWAPNDPARIRGNANVYSRWPATTVVRRGLKQTPAVVASLGGGSQRGDMYAGKDGRVYEHRPDGWYQRDNSTPPQKVKPAPKPNTNPATTQKERAAPKIDNQLDNQRQARSLGAARQNEFHNSGHSVGTPHVSAPRSGGGGGGGHAAGGRR